MCMICVEVVKQNMTSLEIARAIRETPLPKDHVQELVEVLDSLGEGKLDEVNEELIKLTGIKKI